MLKGIQSDPNGDLSYLTVGIKLSFFGVKV